MKTTTHDPSTPIKVVVTANLHSITTNNQVYEKEDDVEDEVSTYSANVIYKFWNMIVTLNARQDKPTASKAGKSSTPSTLPVIKHPKMPDALRKHGNFEGDSPEQVAEHIFNDYLQLIIAEGSVRQLSILLHLILRICNTGTPKSNFLSTFGYWRRF